MNELFEEFKEFEVKGNAIQGGQMSTVTGDTYSGEPSVADDCDDKFDSDSIPIFMGIARPTFAFGRFKFSKFLIKVPTFSFSSFSSFASFKPTRTVFK